MAKLDWKEFEIAVANFIKAIDPSAKVGHDVKLLDSHSKTPRQRDVWVNVKVCNHFPVKILISCKRYKRKLNQQDIDAFNGEFISSSAQIGAIYSYSGFSKNALIKANVLGINCCRMFINQPADLPEKLVFISSYCCTPTLSLSILAPLDPSWNFVTWSDLFFLEFKDNGKEISVLDAIVRSYQKGEKQSLDKAKKDFFPSNWARILECTDEKQESKSIKIIIRGNWKIYEGRYTAHLLNGSYNFTSNEFLGSFTTPVLDTQSSDPGEDWTLLSKPPEMNESRPLKSIFLKTCGDVKNALLEQISENSIAVENTEIITKNV